MTPLSLPTVPTATLAAIGLGVPAYANLLREFAKGATFQRADGSAPKGSQGLQLLRILANAPDTPHQRHTRDIVKKESQRFMAVQEAFWLVTPTDSPDFDELRDILVGLNTMAASDCDPGEPCSIAFGNGATRAQVKALFLALPPDIISWALSQGFTKGALHETVAFSARNWMNLLPQLHQDVNEEEDDEQGVWQGDLARLAEVRMATIREVFWEFTSQDSLDLDILRSVIVRVNEIAERNQLDNCTAEIAEEPTPAQTKALFDALPDNLLCGAVSLGFEDPDMLDATIDYCGTHWLEILPLILDAS